MITNERPSWLPPDHQPQFFAGLPGARIVVTDQLREMRAGVTTLLDEGGVVLVDGDPGLGKTFSTDLAIAGLDVESIVIPMPDRPKGKETIGRIWCALTGRRINMRTTELELLEDVVELLTDRRIALIIDEGQHLQTGPLRQLRYLYDHRRTTVLLVIVGSGADSNVSRNCPELYNRVDRRIKFSLLDLTNATAVARAMHPLYESANPRALHAVWKAAGGCVRSWSLVLRALLTLELPDDTILSEDDVAAALRIMSNDDNAPRRTRSKRYGV